MKKTITIEVESEFHKKLKFSAVMLNITIANLVTTAVNEYLEKKKKEIQK
jgi:predicted transcriptional regulator